VFDSKVFFDTIRASLFSGTLSQQQVDGINFKLGQWRDHYMGMDPRWLSYPLATSYHETSQKMWPIEEYGKGSGKPYGVPDPTTGKTYYGRGDVQLTWADNYKKATSKLKLSGAQDLYWNPEQALDPKISADVMFLGMQEGWFRSDSSGSQTLTRYFSSTKDDPFNAREIINGDKNTIPSWSNGVKIGNLIAGYHAKFLSALQAAWTPDPEPEPDGQQVVVDVTAPDGVKVTVLINGEPYANQVAAA